MQRTKIECEFCGQLISKSNYTKHIRRHQNNPESFVKSENILTHEDLYCKFCGKECKNKNSLRNHERLCKDNPNRQQINTEVRYNFNNPGRIAWNKGLTKETDARVKKSAEALKNRQGTFTGRHHTEETKAKIALSMQDNNHGNNAKKGYYKGIWCGSSYELMYLIYCLDHHIDIRRCDRRYRYFNEKDKKYHLYFPDFIVDSTIIEIKGYYTPLVDLKASSVTDMPIKVLYKSDLEEEFNYVYKTYNVDKCTVSSLYDVDKWHN